MLNKTILNFSRVFTAITLILLLAQVVAAAACAPLAPETVKKALTEKGISESNVETASKEVYAKLVEKLKFGELSKYLDERLTPGVRDAFPGLSDKLAVENPAINNLRITDPAKANMLARDAVSEALRDTMDSSPLTSKASRENVFLKLAPELQRFSKEATLDPGVVTEMNLPKEIDGKKVVNHFGFKGAMVLNPDGSVRTAYGTGSHDAILRGVLEANLPGGIRATPDLIDTLASLRINKISSEEAISKVIQIFKGQGMSEETAKVNAKAIVDSNYAGSTYGFQYQGVLLEDGTIRIVGFQLSSGGIIDPLIAGGKSAQLDKLIGGVDAVTAQLLKDIPEGVLDPEFIKNNRLEVTSAYLSERNIIDAGLGDLKLSPGNLAPTSTAVSPSSKQTGNVQLEQELSALARGVEKPKPLAETKLPESNKVYTTEEAIKIFGVDAHNLKGPTMGGESGGATKVLDQNYNLWVRKEFRIEQAESKAKNELLTRNMLDSLKEAGMIKNVDSPEAFAYPKEITSSNGEKSTQWVLLNREVPSAMRINNAKNKLTVGEKADVAILKEIMGLGDMNSQNLLRDGQGKLWAIDFEFTSKSKGITEESINNEIAYMKKLGREITHQEALKNLISASQTPYISRTSYNDYSAFKGSIEAVKSNQEAVLNMLEASARKAGIEGAELNTLRENVKSNLQNLDQNIRSKLDAANEAYGLKSGESTKAPSMDALEKSAAVNGLIKDNIRTNLPEGIIATPDLLDTMASLRANRISSVEAASKVTEIFKGQGMSAETATVNALALVNPNLVVSKFVENPSAAPAVPVFTNRRGSIINPAIVIRDAYNFVKEIFTGKPVSPAGSVKPETPAPGIESYLMNPASKTEAARNLQLRGISTSDINQLTSGDLAKVRETLATLKGNNIDVGNIMGGTSYSGENSETVQTIPSDILKYPPRGKPLDINKNPQYSATAQEIVNKFLPNHGTDLQSAMEILKQGEILSSQAQGKEVAGYVQRGMNDKVFMSLGGPYQKFLNSDDVVFVMSKSILYEPDFKATPFDTYSYDSAASVEGNSLSVGQIESYFEINLRNKGILERLSRYGGKEYSDFPEGTVDTKIPLNLVQAILVDSAQYRQIQSNPEIPDNYKQLLVNVGDKLPIDAYYDYVGLNDLLGKNFEQLI